MIKYRNATNKHMGIKGLVRSISRLRFAIRDAAVAAFLPAPGFTNVGLIVLPSISTSVYASASHKSITALPQLPPFEGGIRIECSVQQYILLKLDGWRKNVPPCLQLAK